MGSKQSEATTWSGNTSNAAMRSAAIVDVVQAPFRVDVDEQDTGADKILDCGALVYMQFKKSTGLRPTTRASTRKNKSKKSASSVIRRS